MTKTLEHFSSKESQNNFFNYSDLSSYEDFHDVLKSKLGLFYEKEKDTNLYNSLKSIEEKQDKILAVTNGKKVTGIEWSGINIIVYIEENWEEQEMVFDLYQDNIDKLYIWNDSVAAYKEKQEKQKAIATQAIKVDFILQVMDHVFQKNETEWFDELNSDDKLNQTELLDALDDSYEEKLKLYGIDYTNWEYSNLSLLNLQELFKSELGKYNELSIDVTWDDVNSRALVLDAKDKYLDMIMWISDKYEWWASYLNKKESEFEWLLEEITENKSIEELFSYLIDKHNTIDWNDYQSTSVEESYKLYITKLHSIIFAKLKSSNDVTEEQFLQFARIITGRHQIWVKTNYVWKDDRAIEEVVYNDIDDNLRDQALSNEIILEVISKENGVMDRIKSDPDIVVEDDEVWNQLPKNIVLDVVYQIEKKSWVDIEGTQFIKSLWFWDVLELWTESYKKIDLEQQIKVSILVRLLEKLRWLDQIEDLEIIPKLLLEVAQDANKEVVDSLNDNFDAQRNDWWWKEGKDFVDNKWNQLLSQTQIEIFDLYQDINGNWLFDFSDNEVWYTKTAWKVLTAIVVWIATAPILLPAAATAVTTWAVIWLVATATAIALNPQWFDTKKEAAIWLSWEMALWGLTWAAWWVLVQRLWKTLIAYKWSWISNKFLHWVKQNFVTKNWWRNNSIFAADLIWLWFWVEMARMYWMNDVFHNKPIFEQEKTE